MFALIQSLPLDLVHESDDNALQLANVIHGHSRASWAFFQGLPKRFVGVAENFHSRC